MTRVFFLLAALAALAPLRAADLSVIWQTRIAALSAPATLSADFTEARFTPLKKRPVEVSGTVRLLRGRGLSLAYHQLGSPVVILDEKGLLLRLANGSERTAPPEAETDLHLLRALFLLDLPTLEESYALTASETPDGTWSLTFTRLPEATASYRELTLTGTADRLTAIALVKTPKLRTQITLSPPTVDHPFSAPDLARFFR